MKTLVVALAEKNDSNVGPLTTALKHHGSEFRRLDIPDATSKHGQSIRDARLKMIEQLLLVHADCSRVVLGNPFCYRVDESRMVGCADTLSGTGLCDVLVRNDDGGWRGYNTIPHAIRDAAPTITGLPGLDLVLLGKGTLAINAVHAYRSQIRRSLLVSASTQPIEVLQSEMQRLTRLPIGVVRMGEELKLAQPEQPEIPVLVFTRSGWRVVEDPDFPSMICPEVMRTLPSGSVVMDLLETPSTPTLESAARDGGLNVVSGYDFMAHRVARQLMLITDGQVDVADIRRGFDGAA